MNASAGGTTASERYLMRLARRSFLSLWSFANVYRDSGRSGGKGDGKELTDVLVFFNEHVLIFSDKHCEYPSHADESVAWGRWYRRAIEKSARQLVGARDWIIRMPERVFLDSKCTQRFPLPFPPPDKAKFHLIAVTRGALDACRAYFGSESLGSLCLNMDLRGTAAHVLPFTVGRVLDEPFIHVIDEFSLDILLKELDTITDFVRYLERREKFLGGDQPTVMASGEEQLAAIYLTKMNADGEHDFVLPPAEPGKRLGLAYIEEGFWERLVENPQYIAKKAADKISYAWDRLIEHFVSHADPATMADSERALRYLASESRFSRRNLSEYLIGALRKDVPPGDRFARCGASADDPTRCYVFLVLPRPPFVETYEEYRVGRRNLLQSYCAVAKLIAPDATMIIGIAAEPSGTVGGGSEDLVAMDASAEHWTEEREREARQIQADIGIFLERRIIRHAIGSQEFPDIPAAARGKLSPAQRLQERERQRNLERIRQRKYTTKDKDPRRF